MTAGPVDAGNRRSITGRLLPSREDYRLNEHACKSHLVRRWIRALPVNLNTPWYSLFKVRADWSKVSPTLDAVILELVRR